jgi:hypothetical protein
MSNSSQRACDGASGSKPYTEELIAVLGTKGRSSKAAGSHCQMILFNDQPLNASNGSLQASAHVILATPLDSPE